MIGCFKFLALAGVLVFGMSISAVDAADKPSDTATPRQKVVQQMAHDLIAGLNAKPDPTTNTPSLSDRLKQSAEDLKQWWKKEKSADPQSSKRRIAIWPFWHEDSAVSEDFAEMLSDSLLAELLRHRQSNDVYVARDDLKIVTKDIDDFNHLRRSSEKIAELIRNAGADILIIGEVKPGANGRTVHIRYRATNVRTGVIPATTDWYRLAYDFDRSEVMGVGEAIQRSARHFRRALPSMHTIRPQGIRFADSGIQTPFGKWFSARLINELQKLARLNGQAINVADALISDQQIASRGLKLAQKSADQQMAATPTNDYVLTGGYWLLGQIVDMQLSLLDGSGNAQSWQGNIRVNSIDLPLKPTETFGSERDRDNFGPITLNIRSNKGADPIYRVGEKMVLFVETSRDSHLYCFYRQADGAIMRVFPNRYHKESRIRGGSVQHIPSATMDFDLIVKPPTGVEIMKCFAFDRDIHDELPRLVRKLDFEALPYRSIADLGLELRSIRGTAIAENSMVVNVEKQP